MRGDTDDWLPLTGLRVVDTTDSSSWSSGRLLADLGAEVIRVERNAAPITPLWATRHANKRSIICESVRELEQLLTHADIWFDSGSDDVDVASVRRDHPQLVVVSSSAFGRVRRLCGLPGKPRGRVLVVGAALDVSASRSRATAPTGATCVRSRCRHGRLSRAGSALESAGRRRGRPHRAVDPRSVHPDDRHRASGRVRSRQHAGGHPGPSRLSHPRRARATARREPPPVDRLAGLGRRSRRAARRRSRDLRRPAAAPRRHGFGLWAVLRGHHHRGDLRRGTASRSTGDTGDVARTAARQ